MKTAHILLSFLLSIPASAQTVWTLRNAPAYDWLASPAGRPGLYLVASGSYTSSVPPFIRSTDGASWTPSPLTLRADKLYCFNNRILGFDTEYSSTLGSSRGLWITDDGLTAATVYTPAAGEVFRPAAAAYGNSTWVVAGDNGRVYYSKDNAATWTGTPTPAGFLRTIAFGSAQFVASDGAGIITSPDGITWTVRATPSVVVDYPIVYAAGRFQTKSSYSTSGITWSALSVNNPAGNIVAGTSNFLAFSGATFYTSTTGAWSQAQAPIIADSIVDAALCGDLWIATTYSGKLLTSPAPGLPPPTAPALNITPALRLSWQSQTGRSYIIQRSVNNTAWTDYTGIMLGTGAVMEWLAPASASREFFRVQVR